MLEELGPLNERFAAKGWPDVKIGIGLNTGNMNVGNMGSEFRMAYTVLGDSVNLGSRVEGLTKEYGVLFIVTEFTSAEAPEYEYRILDNVRVKGKDKPVTILEPIGLSEEVSEAEKDERDRYHAALELYKQQRFADAIDIFERLDREYGERYVHQLYVKRCQHFIDEPPAKDWDGVYTFTTK